jgi:Tol biopolymer transport system component
MPFVEGAGLDKRIAEGPRNVTEILEIAIQTAEALEEAHGKQIVHRDIKPANIIVQQRGRGRLHCVLMDFGLARLSQATKLTREGSQLGTAAYMSPEQVQGAAVDQRSDIWSLGVVLYEMAVGRLPFAAEYEQALFYGILSEQPEPMTALRTGLPMELERITGKCLAKDPDARYQSATDLLVDLQALRRTVEGSAARAATTIATAPTTLSGAGVGDAQRVSSPGLSGSSAVPAPADAAALRRRFNAAQLLAFASAAAALAALLTWSLAGREAAPPAVPDYTLRRMTWDGQLVGSPGLSQDGRLLTYASDRAGQGNLDIWLQQVDGGSLIQLTNDPIDEVQPSFSPDGTRIAFTRIGKGVYVVPALGGDAFLVAQDGYSPKFSPDGNTIAYLNAGKLYVTPVSMGQPTQLLAGFEINSPPLWSPDGSRLLVFGNAKGDALDWLAAPLDGSAPKKLGAREVFEKSGVSFYALEAWSWSGLFIVIESAGNIYRVPMDVPSLRVSGSPQRLTFGSGLEAAPAGSSDGKITFMDVQQQRDIYSLRLDPRSGLAAGDLERLTEAASRDTGSDVSPDGRRLVYISNRWGSRDLWTKDLTTGKEVNLSNDSAEQEYPVLSADGERIAYMVMEKGRQAIYVRPFEGGVGRPLCSDCGPPRSWSPDGRYLLFDRDDPAATYTLDVSSGEKKKIIGSPNAGLYLARVSRDGNWLLFRAEPTEGAARLLIAPFRGSQEIPEQEWMEVISDGGADLPAWNFTADSIYFISNRQGSWDLWMQRLDPATKRPQGEPQVVRRFPFMRQSLVMMGAAERRLSIGRDRLVFAVTELAGSVWLMEPKATGP